MQQQKSQDVFLRPSFPGHLLEMSNGCGFHPHHHRHFCASVHVNLDVQKSSLAFYLSIKIKGSLRTSTPTNFTIIQSECFT